MDLSRSAFGTTPRRAISAVQEGGWRTGRYSTLHRFAVEEQDFGKSAPTVPVADGKPGEELEVDTGWVITLAPNVEGKRRRKRAWVFTPNHSAYHGRVSRGCAGARLSIRRA